MALVATPPFPDAERPMVRPASALLREILRLTSDFEGVVSRALHVNRRDFEAMQHSLMSGPLSPSEIARRLDVTTAAATVIVDRLSAVGHVARQPHPTDRRGVIVVPSAQSASQAMGNILPLILGVDAALDGFDAAEQQTITAYLQRVVDVYSHQLDETIAQRQTTDD